MTGFPTASRPGTGGALRARRGRTGLHPDGGLGSGRVRRVRAVRVAVAALSSLLLGACATQPSTTLRENLQTTKTGDSSSRTKTTLAEIGVQDELGPDLQYRVGERYIRSDFSLRNAGVSSRERRTLHQPSLDLVLTAGTLRWIQGYDLQQTLSEPSSGADNRLTRTDLLQKLEWAPVDLPQVTAWLDRRSENDDLFVDRTDTETVVKVEEVRGPFNYQLSLVSQSLRDQRSEVDQEIVDRIGRVTWREAFLDEELSTSVSVFQQDRHSRTTFPGAASGVPLGEVFPTAGFSALDSTPEISVLPANGALVDGDVNTSAGVNIGGFASGGEIGWNMAAALPVNSDIDLAMISTADTVEPFFADDFAFSVWVSEDNNFWSLVSPSASYSYEASFRRFRIKLPPLDAPYVKIVNTAGPPGAPAVLVTELRFFGKLPGTGATSTSVTDRTRNVTGNMSWRAADDLTLGYDVFVQDAVRENDDLLTRDEQRLDSGVNALWTPTSIVSVSARANQQRVDDAIQPDQVFSTVSGLVDVAALETLDVAASYTGTRREREDQRDFLTEATQLRTAAQLLDQLRSEVFVEQSTQTDRENARVIRRTTLGASAIAELTSAVDLTVGVRDEQARVTGAGAPGIPDPSEQVVETLVLYQPSDQFTAEAEFEWRDTFAGKGLDQRFRIDWIPFPDGAIDIQLDAQRFESRSSATRIDRYLLLTRWTANPSTFMEWNVAVQKPQGADSTESTSLSLNILL